jgi:hypothetical protein
MTPNKDHPQLASISFALAVGSACALPLVHAAAARAEPPPPMPGAYLTPAEQTMTFACPSDVPDAAIVTTPTSEGAELLFLSPRHTIELRRRVRVLSRMPGHGSVARVNRSAPNEAEIAATEPAAAARNVPGGAVLRLTARDAALIADVQAHPIEYAQRLAGDTCALRGDATPVLPADGKKAASPPTLQVPPGIVPGVGGVDAGPMLNVPGLAF